MIVGIEANHANKEQRTGVENYCWQMINNLKKQIPSDVRVILYSQKPFLPGLAENMPKNWEVKILKWPFGKLWSQARLSLEMFFNPPDIFFAPGQLIPFFCPKNTVVTLHDSAFLVNKKAYKFCGRLYLKWMNKRIIAKAKMILTPSQFTKDETIRFYPKVLSEKIFVIPLACDKNIYRFFTKEERDENFPLKFNITKPFAVYLGRLEEKKNISGLIKAFNLLKRDEDIQLVLIGKEGVGFAKIKQEADLSPYKEDIITLGWLENEDIVKILNFSTVFVFPSFYEGFGLPLLESFACKTPVVAAKGHSLEEVGADAVVYFEPRSIVDMSEKIKLFFQNKEFRDNQANLGYFRSENFSWEKTAELTWQLIKRLQN